MLCLVLSHLPYKFILETQSISYSLAIEINQQMRKSLQEWKYMRNNLHLLYCLSNYLFKTCFITHSYYWFISFCCHSPKWQFSTHGENHNVCIYINITRYYFGMIFPHWIESSETSVDTLVKKAGTTAHAAGTYKKAWRSKGKIIYTISQIVKRWARTWHVVQCNVLLYVHRTVLYPLTSS